MAFTGTSGGIASGLSSNKLTYLRSEVRTPDTMRTMSSTDFQQSNSRDAFRTTHSRVLSSGFLTPTQYESRRDSIASSQSSYCQSFSSSEYSSMSTDYSMPVTPTCAQSPLAEDGLTDISSYELSNDFQGHPFHGLPLTPRPKSFVVGENLCDGWAMVHPQVEHSPPQPIPFRPEDIPHVAGDFGTELNAHLVQHPSTAGFLASSSWDNLSTIVWAGREHLLDDIIDHRLRRGFGANDIPAYCPELIMNQIGSPQGVPTGTIMPPDSMIDVQDHVIIQPNTFDHRYALEDTDPLVLQSLEEAPLKEELPVPVKEEPSDHEDTKPLRKIHVTRTGGKRVKKEARTGGASKKYIKEQRLPGGGRFILELEEGISAVNENGRDVFRRVYGSPREKKYCTELVNGRICGRAFVRPEHLKRHQKTHSDERNFGCVICSRKFGRNDNYQEHYWTHVKQPGKKNGRNFKFSLEAVEEKVGDIKLIEKLRSKWRKEVEKKSAKRIARR